MCFHDLSPDECEDSNFKTDTVGSPCSVAHHELKRHGGVWVHNILIASYILINNVDYTEKLNPIP